MLIYYLVSYETMFKVTFLEVSYPKLDTIDTFIMCAY